MVEYPFFTAKELGCQCGKCGRGPEHMNSTFMSRLIAIRRELGAAMPVTSAYRCPEHNSNVSSTGESGPHTTGRAVDVAIRGPNALKLVALAHKHGMTGVGVSQKGESRFIHLDDLGNGYPRPNIWSY